MVNKVSERSQCVCSDCVSINLKVLILALQLLLNDSGCCVGIEPTGNRVLRPAEFTVDTFSAGQGQVTVYLDHPDGTREEVNSDGSVGGVESKEL